MDSWGGRGFEAGAAVAEATHIGRTSGPACGQQIAPGRRAAAARVAVRVVHICTRTTALSERDSVGFSRVSGLLLLELLWECCAGASAHT